jgi:hypothetical protein
MAPTGDDLAGPPAPPHPPRPPPPPPPSRAPAETPTPTNHAAAISSPLLQPQPAPGAAADAPLSRWLRRLEAFLSAAGLAASTPLGVAAAASALAVVGLALPAAAVALSPCRGGAAACGDFEVEVFEVCVLLSQAAAAAVALACVSRKVAVHGLRRFLFVDPDLGMRIRFQKEYVARIQVKVPPHSCFGFIYIGVFEFVLGASSNRML